MWVYWTKLYAAHLKHPTWVHTDLYWWHNVNKHATPFIALTIIFLTSKPIAFKQTWGVKVFWFWYFVISCMINATGQFVRGVPLYPIVCWIEKPFQTVFIMLALTFANSALYYVFGKFTMRWHGLDKDEKEIKKS